MGLAVVVACVMLAPGGQGEPPPVPFDAYWTQVAVTAAVIEGVAGADSESVREALDFQAALWEPIDSVALPDGSVMVVDSAGVVEALRADPPDLEGLEARFGAMLETREAWFGEPGSGAGQGAASLAEILARPEFQWESEEPPPPNLFEEFRNRIRQWIFEQLDAILPDGMVTVEGVDTLVLITAALVLALILALALRGIFRDVVAESELEEALDDDGEPLTAESALERAQEVARGGDYRSAVRYLYLSTLLQLEDRGLLRYDRAATNREYLRSVAHRPDLASVLRDVVDVFDRTWYGFHSLDQATYAEYEARVGELRRLR